MLKLKPMSGQMSDRLWVHSTRFVPMDISSSSKAMAGEPLHLYSVEEDHSYGVDYWKGLTSDYYFSDHEDEDTVMCQLPSWSSCKRGLRLDHSAKGSASNSKDVLRRAHQNVRQHVRSSKKDRAPCFRLIIQRGAARVLTSDSEATDMSSDEADVGRRMVEEFCSAAYSAGGVVGQIDVDSSLDTRPPVEPVVPAIKNKALQPKKSKANRSSRSDPTDKAGKTKIPKGVSPVAPPPLEVPQTNMDPEAKLIDGSEVQSAEASLSESFSTLNDSDFPEWLFSLPPSTSSLGFSELEAACLSPGLLEVETASLIASEDHCIFNTPCENGSSPMPPELCRRVKTDKGTTSGKKRKATVCSELKNGDESSAKNLERDAAGTSKKCKQPLPCMADSNSDSSSAVSTITSHDQHVLDDVMCTKEPLVDGDLYHGVTRSVWGKWVAEISDSSRGVRVWLGCYDRPEIAARAYDAAALALWGPSAETNFPVTDEVAFSTRAKADGCARTMPYAGRKSWGKSPVPSPLSNMDAKSSSHQWFSKDGDCSLPDCGEQSGLTEDNEVELPSNRALLNDCGLRRTSLPSFSGYSSKSSCTSLQGGSEDLDDDRDASLQCWSVLANPLLDDELTSFWSGEPNCLMLGTQLPLQSAKQSGAEASLHPSQTDRKKGVTSSSQTEVVCMHATDVACENIFGCAPLIGDGWEGDCESLLFISDLDDGLMLEAGLAAATSVSVEAAGDGMLIQSFHEPDIWSPLGFCSAPMLAH